MAERSEAVEEQAVRDASAAYSVEPDIATAEDVPPGYKRTEVGVIPEDWGIGCLGDFYEIKSSKRVLQRDWRRYGVPFYRTREVAVLAEAGHVDNELHISEELYSVYAKKYGVPKPGDVLVTGIGTIGKMYVVPDDRKFYFKDASIIWLKSRQSLNSSYLEQLFETRIIHDQLADASTGTTVDTYTISGANKTAVPVPHITEQRAIATALSDADALIAALDRLIAKKRAIKQAAMQQLLTGQTRLPGFTGDWETKRLGDLFRIRVATSKARHITHGGQFLIVDMGSVSRSGQLIASKPTNYQGDYLAKGELVMPKDDIGGGGIIGKVAFIDANHRYILGDHVYALTIKEGNPRFLSYQINSYKVNTALRSKVSGSAQLGLARTAVLEQELHTPAAEEQAAIATALSDMDTEIEALDRRCDKARQIKQGMMQQLLTGKVRLV